MPLNVWFTLYTRPSTSELAIFHVCRQLRIDALEVFYRCNHFAIDFRSELNAALAWKWLNSLALESISFLRKMRLTTVIECPSLCYHSDLNWNKKSGFLVGTARATPDMGTLAVTVSIDRGTVEDPYFITIDTCGMCEEKPMQIAGRLHKIMESIGLEDKDIDLDRHDLVAIFSYLQSISSYGDAEFEEDVHEDVDDGVHEEL